MFFKFVGLLPERIFKKGRPARSCTVLLAKGLFFYQNVALCVLMALLGSQSTCCGAMYISQNFPYG